MSADLYAEAERAYRKARWTIIGHGAFVAACLFLALWVRRFLRSPGLMIGFGIVAALIVFGVDIIRFIRCRDRLRELQSQTHS